MKKLLLAILGFAIVAGIGIGYYFVVYPMMKKNEFVRTEANMDRLLESRQLAMSEMTESMKIEGSIIKNKDQFMLDLVGKATGGTFGPNGAQQAILLLKQDYPDMGEDLRSQIISGLKSGYAKFTRKQEELSTLKNWYVAATNPDTWPSGDVAVKYGFPKVDMSKYDMIISSTARKAEETKTIDAEDFNPFTEKKPEEKPEAEKKE